MIISSVISTKLDYAPFKKKIMHLSISEAGVNLFELGPWRVPNVLGQAKAGEW